MTVIEVLLRLGGPDFILIHVDKIHSEYVTRVAHILKIHCSVPFVSQTLPEQYYSMAG